MFVGDAVGFRVGVIARLKELELIALRAWLGESIALTGRDFGEMEDEALLVFVATEIDEQGEEIGVFEDGFAAQCENEGGDIQTYVLGNGVEGEGGVRGLFVSCVSAFNHSSQYLMKLEWLFHEWLSGSVLLCSVGTASPVYNVVLYLASTRIGKAEKSTACLMTMSRKFVQVVVLVVIYRKIDKKGAVK
jgi:hypothetical protein